MRPGVPGSRAPVAAALAPLLALLLSCGSGANNAVDGGGPEAGAGPELTVTTTSLPGGMVDVKYHAALAAKGGWRPLTWLIAEGTLPGGLTLNPATGNIDGVPTQDGQFALTVQATDSGIPQQSDNVQLTLRIQPRPGPVTITTTSPLPNGQVGGSYSVTLEASGGATPYAWSVDSGGLPDGLRLSFAQSGGGNFTWTINGTPTRAGDWSFVLRVNDSLTTSQTATQPFTLHILPPPPLVIDTASLPNAERGNEYSAALAASGGLPPYAWQLVTGTLPAGLIFPTLAADGGVYAIHGTPTALGTSTFTVRVVDSYQPANRTEKQLAITVVQPPQQDAGVQDDAAQSDAAQSDAAQSDAAQSDAAQSDAAQQDVAVQDDAAIQDDAAVQDDV